MSISHKEQVGEIRDAIGFYDSVNRVKDTDYHGTVTVECEDLSRVGVEKIRELDYEIIGVYKMGNRVHLQVEKQ